MSNECGLGAKCAVKHSDIVHLVSLLLVVVIVVDVADNDCISHTGGGTSVTCT